MSENEHSEPLPDDMLALMRGMRRESAVAVPDAARERLLASFGGAFLGGPAAPSLDGSPPHHDGAPTDHPQTPSHTPEAPPLGTSAPDASGASTAAATHLARPGAALLASKASLAIGSLVVGSAVGAGVHATLAPPRIIYIAASATTSAAPPTRQLPTETPPLAGVLASSEPATTLGSPDASAAPASASAISKPSSAATARPDSSATLSRDAQLSAERNLIDMARTAVGRGQASAAIAALQRHATEYPNGQLVEEREGLWVQSLLLAGRRDEARARVERFRLSFPRSMMLPALESALQ